MFGLRSFASVCLTAYTSAFTLDTPDFLEVQSGNPFSRTQNYYVNPVFKDEIQSSIDTSSAGKVKDYLIGMKEVASSFWLDRKSVISGTSTTKTAEGILADAAASGDKKLVVLMVYDLPNRDCHVSSN